ncbi:hypothetical protein F5890DRAFT_1552974 [Lentinula detonsa]|uniref:N-alpha-acetyltransferase 40 n=1 Tax=Lentinula detonsa TaxID=2804962 RepID=A0AA38Q2H5_9AGAR|nr:hypothetical protein F5890DRAFT_1552974 [Lentinula detonsa]
MPTEEEKSLSEGSETVRRANTQSAKQLALALQSAVGLPDAYNCVFWLADELLEDTRAQLWQSIDGNMRGLKVAYIDSSMGWNPPDKRQELFNSLGRFILLSPVNKPDEVAGYSAFRFEHEAEEDILYCYELQINPLHQRKGLGRFLMNLLEVIGRRTKMEKIMLTVLDNNLAANKFYKQIRFQLDECSPTYEDLDDESGTEKVDVDYQILSKLLT